jgi:hypothetical protein
MSLMHSDDIEDLEVVTIGERTVFRFFQESTRPDSDFIGWHEPAIGNYSARRAVIAFDLEFGSGRFPAGSTLPDFPSKLMPGRKASL